MSQCKSCGRTIIWAKSPIGKNIPLERIPQIYQLGSENGEATAIVVEGHTGSFSVPMFMSHFVTCPNANEHSRSRGPDPQASFEL